METRYTITQAIDDVPYVESPHHVTDVVILTGINDNKTPRETNAETEAKHVTLMSPNGIICDGSGAENTNTYYICRVMRII